MRDRAGHRHVFAVSLSGGPRERDTIVATEFSDLPELPVYPALSPTDQLTEAASLHQARIPEIVLAPVTNADELRQVQLLRGQVGSNHDPARAADTLDQDEYDQIALHVAGWRGRELVATGRLVFPEPDRSLPMEAGFDLHLSERESLVEVGRVVVAPAVSDSSHRVLLALLGELWLHARGRHLWVGANTAAVIRLYRSLGARPEVLGKERLYHGERRYPVQWNMEQFAPAFHALSQRENVVNSRLVHASV